MTEYEELKKLADSFFDWPTEDRTQVTLTSAILFAQHVIGAAPQQAAEPVVITLGKGDKLVADIFADDSGGVVHKAGVGIFDPTPGTIYGVGVKDTRADGLPITADRNPLVLIWSDKPESLQVIVDELQESIARLAGQPPAQPHPWAPNRFEYDRSIHSCPDAKAWADLFVQTFPGLADKHDLMVTWFANAMMAMHDHLQRKSAQPAPIPTSERLPTEADGDCYGNVWWWNTKKETWILLAWSASLDDRCWPHWLPTGLTRPAAPGGE